MCWALWGVLYVHHTILIFFSTVWGCKREKTDKETEAGVFSLVLVVRGEFVPAYP